MIELKMHDPAAARLSPNIAVIGVGGGGGNAVSNMISSGLEGCHFLACNTDAQALENCLAEAKIQLGTAVTGGLGAGSRPEVGRAAAEESMEDILSCLEGANMVFVTAGMGGGTGTGAAPVIAKACRDRGILTVGVVTKPFHFEGAHRMRLAEAGLEEMQGYVDTLIVIPNQNLFRIANEKTTFAEGFRMADSVLQSGVKGVTDLIVRPGLVNLDFADIKTAMQEMGKAMMGTGEASGDKRAVQAAEAAINNPLLDDVSMKGARGVIINITGGLDMALFEVDEACNRIRDEVDPGANIIFGATFDEGLEGLMRVSIVATGIDREVGAGHDGEQGSGSADTGGGPRRSAPVTPASRASAGPVLPQRPATEAYAPPPMAQAAAAPAPHTEEDGELLEQRVFAEEAPAPVGRALGTPQAQRYQGAFIPPSPVEAFSPGLPHAQRPPAGPPPAPVVAQTVVPAAPAAQQRRTPNFFERLTGAMPASGAARPAAQENLEMRAPPAARPREAAPRGDEGLDIPAFLRRQAN